MPTINSERILEGMNDCIMDAAGAILREDGRAYIDAFARFNVYCDFIEEVGLTKEEADRFDEVSRRMIALARTDLQPAKLCS